MGTKLKSFLIGAGGAIIGAALWWLAWHVWQDHQVHHEMLKVLQSAIQQQQQAAKPPTP